MDKDRWFIVIALMAVVISTAVALVVVGAPGEEAASNQSLLGLEATLG